MKKCAKVRSPRTNFSLVGINFFPPGTTIFGPGEKKCMLLVSTKRMDILLVEAEHLYLSEP